MIALKAKKPLIQMKCSTVSYQFPTLILGDLEFEFRDQSTLDRDIKIQSLKFDYEKDRILENKKNIPQGKSSENKTNLPDLRFENNNENISLNSNSLFTLNCICLN